MEQKENLDRSREVRLGLVMYGGVSLAIYIHGVAQEFFRAVRGRGVYRLIKALTDSDIVVDIISGTSAGGINGILLAYALCNEMEFPACASLWRNEGDFLSLLRSPSQDVDEATSFIDGEVYQAALEKAFQEMRPCSPDQQERLSPIPELDLFVTGTDVHGRVYTCFDEAGHPIDVKDHRTVFLLKHRAGRKEPFAVQPSKDAVSSGNPEITCQSLAKLARITSTFPAAFPPVPVEGPDQGGDKVDANLRLWGWFDQEAYFIDGGVLDNKPFTYTIREIFFRLASRQVDRKLFYVEPDPKRFEPAKAIEEPNILEVVFKSLVSIPGYESISEDLKLLAEHNDRVVRYHQLVKALDEEVDSRGEKCLPENTGHDSALYKQTKITFLAERVVRGILKQDGHHRLLDPNVRVIAAELYKSVHSSEQKWLEALEDFDVYFRLRRLFHVLYACPDPDPECSPEENKLRADILYNFGRQIKLLEIVAVTMDRLMGEADFKWEQRDPGELWGLVNNSLQCLVNLAWNASPLLPSGYQDAWTQQAPADWLNQKALSEVNKALGKKVTKIKNLVQEDNQLLTQPADSDNSQKLFVVTDACEKRMLEYFSQEIERLALPKLFSLTKRYNNFKCFDAQLFPLEAFAGFAERDVVETVRISPLDAQKGFSRLTAEDKVSGDVLHHFGGFCKKSWRSNDILWGRLDGLCMLLETLLKPDSSRQGGLEKKLTSQQRQGLLQDLQGGLNPAVLFPHASSQTQETLRDWLTRLIDGNKEEGEAAPDDFDEHLELLIEAAQLEILYEEVPRVISDALEEEMRWRQPKGKAPKKGQGTESTPPPPVDCSLIHQQGTGALDQLVLRVSAEQLAKQVVAEMETTPAAGKNVGWPRDDGLGRFFTEKYQVGGESVARDVPQAYLWEVLAKALPVARNCLLKVAGTYGETLQKNFLFKALDYLLRWGVRGAIVFSRQPTWRKVVAGLAGGLVLLWVVKKLFF